MFRYKSYHEILCLMKKIFLILLINFIFYNLDLDFVRLQNDAHDFVTNVFCETYDYIHLFFPSNLKGFCVT